MRWMSLLSVVLMTGCLSARQGGVGTSTGDALDTYAAADGAGSDASVPGDTTVGPADATDTRTSGGPGDTAGAYDTLLTADTSVGDTMVDTSVVDTAGGEVITVGCPEAVITAAEGAEVIPQTVLHLTGAGSHGLAPIVGYEWTVEQPSGSVSVFLPASSVGDPCFEANVVGTYVFHLSVVDAEGRVSCQPATYVVHVTSVSALHVELVWTTPGDPDETDIGYDAEGTSVGSDVDLHLVHPDAVNAFNPEGWFDSRYDCFWSDSAPNWEGAGAADDPRLDRDDTDGGGPENINLDILPVGRSYRIGVHYWDDWGYGPAFATVRVYRRGVPVGSFGPKELVKDDLWEVATVASEGAVTPGGRCEADGAPCARDADCGDAGPGACTDDVIPLYASPWDADP